ncbi:[NiFe]-hydrogenase assembly chaperone HybE [Thiomicrorhabdus immobilis]|nr:[NiFe]-hydrogenase assembly chaperone HybE [Thiomicrorhabdus immobilis]
MSNSSQKSEINQPTRPGQSDWQFIQAKTLQEAHDLIIDTFKNTYHKNFEDEWMGVNHNLEVELRGVKFVDGWITGFLLTPWMLCNLYVPVLAELTEDLQIEEEWQAQARLDQDYMVIGPLKTFEIGGAEQKGYLNYHVELGHYLLQPLVQIMDKYADNEKAFAAWSEVIAFRKAHYEKVEQELAARQLAEQQAKDNTEDGIAVDENEVLDRRGFLSKWL